MAVRLVTSGGHIVDPVVINMYASGVVQRNSVVELSRTGGAGVFPASSSSTSTGVFGICLDYAQGASDVQVKVIPFASGQIWEVDTVNTVSTAQIGLRHVMNDNLNLRNTATDLGAGNNATGIFRAIAVSSISTGSGKLLGYFRTSEGTVFPSGTTYA